jgi:hypothetical protein
MNPILANIIIILVVTLLIWLVNSFFSLNTLNNNNIVRLDITKDEFKNSLENKVQISTNVLDIGFSNAGMWSLIPSILTTIIAYLLFSFALPYLSKNSSGSSDLGDESTFSDA